MVVRVVVKVVGQINQKPRCRYWATRLSVGKWIITIIMSQDDLVLPHSVGAAIVVIG